MDLWFHVKLLDFVILHYYKHLVLKFKVSDANSTSFQVCMI